MPEHLEQLGTAIKEFPMTRAYAYTPDSSKMGVKNIFVIRDL
jgi:hypothetical protein